MNSISSDAFERALAAQGLDAGKDSRSPAFVAAHARFRELTWNLLRRLLDLTRAASGGKVVKSEHIRDLCKLVRLLHAPLPMCGNRGRGRKVVKGGHSGTVMTGSFFDPANGPDATAYSSAHGAPAHMTFPDASSGLIRSALSASDAFPVGGARGGHGGTVMTGSFFDPANGPDASAYSSSHGAPSNPTFPDASSGLIRNALGASDAFPVAVSGGRGGTGKRTPCSWLTPDALGELVREYNARAGADLRIGESARLMVRRMVQGAVDSIVADACGGGSKQRRITADSLMRAACRSCMCTKLFGGG